MKKKIIIILFAFIISLVICELILRFFFPAPEFYRVEKKQESSNNSFLSYKNNSGHIRLNPEISVFVENMIPSGRTVHIKTNSIGLRNDELTNKKHTRIYFIGDSITFGQGVESDETFVSQLSEKSKNGKFQFESINGGILGADMESSVSFLKEILDKIEPDIVLFCFYLNDLEQSRFKRKYNYGIYKHSYLLSYITEIYGFSKSILFMPKRNNLIKKEIKETMPKYNFNYAGLKNILKLKIIESLNDWGAAWSESSWNNTKPLFLKFKEITKSRCAIVFFPGKFQCLSIDEKNAFPQSKLSEITNEFQIPYLDLLPLFQAESSSNIDKYFYDHCHLTPEGHKFVSVQIINFLNHIIDK